MAGRAGGRFQWPAQGVGAACPWPGQKAGGTRYHLSWDTVEEDSRSCRGEEERRPSTPARWESPSLHDVEKIVPPHRIKSLGNVQLDEEGRGAGSVKTASRVPDVHEIIVDASLFDEGALAGGNDVVHFRTKSQSHSFGNNLRDDVNEADWP